MLDQWIAEARAGRPVWIGDVREGCPDAVPVVLQLQLQDGGLRQLSMPLPRWQTPEQRDFVSRYAAACAYNALSALSAREAAFYLDLREEDTAALLGQMEEVFQVHRTRRSGYGKVINIADRLCRGFGGGAFSFAIRDIRHLPPLPETKPEGGALLPRLRQAVRRTDRGVCCGIDVGGTDIKAAVSRDGRLLCVKEYDWDPASSSTAEGILAPMELLVRLMACCAAGPITPQLRRALRRDATDREMAQAVAAHPAAKPDVLGVSFPDIVIRDKVAGGETPKMKGMRDNPALDYEAAFGEIRELRQRLLPLCAPGAAVHLANDGHIAAFTAAAELAFSGDVPDLSGGVIAHSLGTDFGFGCLLPDGSIPQTPMELYDFLLDLGSLHRAQLPPEDLRSTRNENSGLAGARRYLGQAAAFRLAAERQPRLLTGFARREEGLLTIPGDLRKPCLEHLMDRAQAGDPDARWVFRQVGVHLGQISRELDWVMAPGTQVRYLFGRFVKSPVCFRLMAEGCRSVLPRLRLEAADEDLACTPLMRDLAGQDVTVAQFGQAVGAMYFAAMEP